MCDGTASATNNNDDDDNSEQAQNSNTTRGERTNDAPSRRGRRRRRRHVDDTADAAWIQQQPQRSGVIDEAPPVAILSESSWRPAVLEYKTSQHLTTLFSPASSVTNDKKSNNSNNYDPSWSTTPLLWKNRYLIVGCKTGQICFWDLTRNECLSKQLFYEDNNEISSGNGINESENAMKASENAMKASAHTRRVSNGLPDAVLDLPSESNSNVELFSVVQITAAPDSFLSNSTSIDENQKVIREESTTAKSFLVAINLLGMVYVIGLNDEGKHDGSHWPPRPYIVAFWHTRRLKSFSVLALIDSSTIVVGYQSNCIEGWTLNPKPIDHADKKSKSSLSQFNAKLAWRAAYEDVHAVSIVSMAQFIDPNPVGNASENVSSSILPSLPSDATSLESIVQVEESFPDQSDTGILHCQFLLLTLRRDCIPSSLSTASLLEVINIQSIEKDWINVQRLKNDIGASVHDYVPIEDHWVLPEAGMEIVDSSTLLKATDASAMPSRAHWIPSMGTNSIYSFPSANSAVAESAVALSDGIVVRLSCRFDSGYVSWGLVRPCDQILLSYPAIGIGGVNCNSRCCDTNLKSHYIACCLRGGTTYLIPASSNDEDIREAKNENIIVFLYPHDIDSDSSLRQIQGFTAGDVLVSPELAKYNDIATTTKSSLSENNQNTLPVFVYSWPGGLIDIYSCGLVTKRRKDLSSSKADSAVESNSQLLLQALIGNGSTTVLQTLLECIDDNELERMDSMWKAARTEVLSRNNEHKISLLDLYSNQLDSFRSILIRLSETSSEI